MIKSLGILFEKCLNSLFLLENVNERSMHSQPCWEACPFLKFSIHSWLVCYHDLVDAAFSTSTPLEEVSSLCFPLDLTSSCQGVAMFRL